MPWNTERIRALWFTCRRETPPAILRHSETLYSPLHNIYMSCAQRSPFRVWHVIPTQSLMQFIHVLYVQCPPEFNIQLSYSTLSNIYMSCELTGQPPKFNIHACPLSSLDTLSSIFSSNELTGDHMQFNIELLCSTLTNIYMSCELSGHPPEFNIQL